MNIKKQKENFFFLIFLWTSFSHTPFEVGRAIDDTANFVWDRLHHLVPILKLVKLNLQNSLGFPFPTDFCQFGFLVIFILISCLVLYCPYQKFSEFALFFFIIANCFFYRFHWFFNRFDHSVTLNSPYRAGLVLSVSQKLQFFHHLSLFLNWESSSFHSGWNCMNRQPVLLFSFRNI